MGLLDGQGRDRHRREPGYRRRDRPAVRRRGRGRRGRRPHDGPGPPRLRARSPRPSTQISGGRRHRGRDPRQPGQARRPGAPGRGDRPRSSAHPDILVSNAAVTLLHQGRGLHAKQYALMFAVQVEAPFELARLVLPGMRDRGARLDTQYLLGGGAASGGAARPVRSRRRHRLRHVQGRASSGSRPASRPSCTTTTSRSTRWPPNQVVPTPGHDLPPPDHRGRPERRAARRSWPRPR